MEKSKQIKQAHFIYTKPDSLVSQKYKYILGWAKHTSQFFKNNDKQKEHTQSGLF